MQFELRGDTQRVTFSGSEGGFTLGGSPRDDVRVKGLPEALLRIQVEGPDWALTAGAPLDVSGVRLLPGIRRLVLPGECVRLPTGMSLRALEEAPPPPPPADTLAILKGIVGSSGSPMDALPSLQCLTGLDMGRRFALGPEAQRLGRGWESEIRLRDHAVSRIHACIVREGEARFIEDAGGINGLQLNGTPVEERRRLENGDILTLGRTQLRFSRPRAAATAGRPPPATAPPPAAPSPNGPERREWAWVAAGGSLLLAGALVLAL